MVYTTYRSSLSGRVVAVLPEEASVWLEVFDVLGRSLAVLVDERQATGRYEVSFDAGRLAGGVYLYRLTAGGREVSRTMTLLK